MRIVNTGYAPRYLSYGDTATGGKTLQPGQESRDLPLGYVHSPVLWKDLEKGLIHLRLNDEDKAFLVKLLAAADKPITMLKPPAPPLPPPPPPPPPPKPVLQPVLVEQVPNVPPSEGTKIVDNMIKNLNYSELMPQGKSLKDLMESNKGIPAFVNQGQKATMAEINTHMGNRV